MQYATRPGMTGSARRAPWSSPSRVKVAGGLSAAKAMLERWTRQEATRLCRRAWMRSIWLGAELGRAAMPRAGVEGDRADALAGGPRLMGPSPAGRPRADRLHARGAARPVARDGGA